MIIKKIFDGECDEEVHIDFLKFGRGVYENKYMLECKKQAKKWSIKTSAEYANFLVRRCLEKMPGEVSLNGIIVSTLDLKDEIPFEVQKVSNFQGVRKNVIKTTAQSSEVIELMNAHPKVFFALSFSGPGFVLKIKAKAPTSGKPGKESVDGPAVDFCSLKIEGDDIVKELFFKEGDFSEASVRHTIEVTDIIYPDNMSELKPAEIREQAKRKGVLKRISSVDTQGTTSETNFVA
jgi:hypothetical protein